MPILKFGYVKTMLDKQALGAFDVTNMSGDRKHLQAYFHFFFLKIPISINEIAQRVKSLSVL